MRRVANQARGVVVVVPVVIALGLVLVAVVEASLVSVRPRIDGGATLDVWRHLLGDGAVRRSAAFTMWIATASAVLATLVALAGYVALRRVRSRWVWALVLLPALLPHVLAGLVVVAWAGPGGILDRVLEARPVELYRDARGVGAISAYVWKETAFVLLLLLAGAPRELRAQEEMARVNGLGGAAMLRTVTLPALARPAVVGFATVLVFAIGALEIPAMLGPTSPQTLAGASADALTLDVLSGQSAAAVLALLTTGLALAGALLVILMATVSGRRGSRRMWGAG